MTSSSVIAIHSRDNTFVKDLRRLAQDTTAYRKQGRVWLEGDHLCRAALARGLRAAVAVFSESFWPQAQFEYAQDAMKTIVLADALFADISGLESPARMGFILDLPTPPALRPEAATVVLDRVQDAGNVGSILRSASAFGFRQVVAIKGSAALWSPKVLRAGMGAHFALDLIEGVGLEDIVALEVPLLVTSSHAGDYLHRAALPWPCAWVMGHEGQGVSPSLEDRAAVRIRIAQPGGEESLNVAAAAAICLHASGAAR
ncbi:TrmH family RNA methyltransferase [Acidovorax sp. 69]|uniref:TrmH family RNA methyltransferase n=1 Tax=Acidovorax sp. 69 TaxID=2035202 RepID=UPI000C24D70E|nr:RNA methyltransferase [Acidovorax sp. 69]PJI98103.1 TrmH family RNA methyltransferase [Acidovorax sp. 69]